MINGGLCILFALGKKFTFVSGSSWIHATCFVARADFVFGFALVSHFLEIHHVFFGSVGFCHG